MNQNALDSKGSRANQSAAAVHVLARCRTPDMVSFNYFTHVLLVSALPPVVGQGVVT